MSKLIDRLEILSKFQKIKTDLAKESAALQERAASTDQAFTKWLDEELSLTGDLHLVDVMKTLLETSYEAKKD